MAGKTKNGAQRARFLLGDTSEAERERLEAEIFSDENAFEEMLAAEDDLIDAYVRGELSESERQEFEKRFLTSAEARERVHFARAFAAGTGPRPVSPQPVITPVPAPGFFASIFGRPAFQFALATIAVVALAGFSWLLVERSRMNQELNALRAERALLTQKAEELQRTADTERARNAETLAQLNDLQRRINENQPPKDVQTGTPGEGPEKRDVDLNEVLANDRGNNPPAEDSVVFDLTAGSTRGGSGNTFEVARNATSIRLRVAVATVSLQQNYRASIETPEGQQVWRSNSFKIEGTTTLLTVPAKNLRAGDYLLFLNGEQPNGSLEQAASYSFRIVRK